MTPSFSSGYSRGLFLEFRISIAEEMRLTISVWAVKRNNKDMVGRLLAAGATMA